MLYVHDEVVIDCPEAHTDLDKILELMTQPITWAVGLRLNAGSWAK